MPIRAVAACRLDCRPCSALRTCESKRVIALPPLCRVCCTLHPPGHAADKRMRIRLATTSAMQAVATVDMLPASLYREDGFG
jgi:hypothetical protein